MSSRNKRLLRLIVFSTVLVIIYHYWPYKLEFKGHYDKVFAHRVNSVQKLNTALKYYKGVELDLVYDDKNDVLDVNHPPAQSIALNLETYIQNIEPGYFPFLWLDIKALDTINALAIYSKLNVIFESRNYPKDKILIETIQPEALPVFTNKGYKTSYYLKPRLRLKTPEELKQEVAVISAILDEQPQIGISTSFEDYNILKTYFPKKTKYIWAILPIWNTKHAEIKTILEDETVEIVLGRYNALRGNR